MGARSRSSNLAMGARSRSQDRSESRSTFSGQIHCAKIEYVHFWLSQTIKKVKRMVSPILNNMSKSSSNRVPKSNPVSDSTRSATSAPSSISVKSSNVVKKSIKAVTHPFKKLKHSLSSRSKSSIASRENDDPAPINTDIIDNPVPAVIDLDDTSSNSIVDDEVDPEKELGMFDQHRIFI
jgi:hypothetical protein